jgi:hypothetical protein
MTTIRMGTAAAVMTLVLAAGVAGAGTPGQQARASDQVEALLNRPATPAATPQAVNDGEAHHRADDAEQDPAELRMTRALNDEIVQRNQLAENQERADQAAFQAERARYELGVAEATQARLAYEEALRQAEAAQRRWEADRARWEADVRACEAGDRTRCAAPGPR